MKMTIRITRILLVLVLVAYGAQLEAATLVAYGDHSGENHSNEDHSYESLVGINLTNSELNHTDFTGTDFSDADFTGASIWGATFADGILRRAVLHNNYMVYTDFTGADLREMQITGGNAFDSRFDNTDLTGATISTYIVDSTFSGASMNGANFGGAYCYHTDFVGAHLEGADFSGAGGLNSAYFDATTTYNSSTLFPLRKRGSCRENGVL